MRHRRAYGPPRAPAMREHPFPLRRGDPKQGRRDPTARDLRQPFVRVFNGTFQLVADRRSRETFLQRPGVAFFGARFLENVPQAVISFQQIPRILWGCVTRERGSLSMLSRAIRLRNNVARIMPAPRKRRRSTPGCARAQRRNRAGGLAPKKHLVHFADSPVRRGEFPLNEWRGG